jgi:Pyruvate/2-oxoacid:ferredoxin oxidoreductase delta subunit
VHGKENIKTNKTENNTAALSPANYVVCEGIETEVKTKNNLTIKEVSGKGKKEDVKIDIIVNYCKGCEICVAFCPEGVLVMNKEVAEVADISKCTKCNICEYLCPDFSISVE